MKRFSFLKKLPKDVDVNALTFCSIVMTVFAVFMTLINIRTHSFTMAIITGCMSLWLLTHLILFKLYNYTILMIVGLYVCAYLSMMYFVISGGVDGFSVVWALIVPPAALYCLSAYYGIIFVVFLGVSISVYMWTPLNTLGYPYSEAYFDRFPIVYAFVGFISCVMEYRIRTYRKQQDELIESLEQAGIEKNNFLANMSHEIRTPMNAIVGMCELILRDDINEDVRDNCFNIQSAGRSLLSIINDILDFSKIESGKIELIEEPFNIASTVNDVVNMAVSRKGEKNVEIIVKLDPTLPSGLIGDEVRIRQVIVNLMTNAIKFTNKGCVILKISQSKHEYGINLNVSVEDTGIGISDDNIEKLFTSFQQVDTRKNRSVEGTGLGLAISKRLVTRMGGFINVNSVYGEGTEFKFVIPLKVDNYEHIVHIDREEKTKLAVYLDLSRFDHQRVNEEYDNLIHDIGNSLGMDFTMFDSFKQLKSAMTVEQYTHCFVNKDAYLANVDWYNEVADKCDVIVAQDRFNSIEVPDNIRKVYKPFYTLTFAAVMNNENKAFDANCHRNFSARFTAPEAKILLVDDNVVNLKVAIGLMKPYNMKIVSATSGFEAIKALETMDYDLVFMDHMMPEMDGVETTQIIRAKDDEYFKKLPIVALTANAVSGEREKFLKNGFDDFLAKPIEVAVLDRILRSWLPDELLITSLTLVNDHGRYVDIYEYEPESEERLSDESEGMYICDIDVYLGLKNSGSSKEVYYDVLDVYTSSSKKYREALIQNYENKNWSEYTVGVHALKSSSFSIGARGLSELAKESEFAGKSGNIDIIEKNHETIIQLYDKVVATAESYLLQQGYNSQTIEYVDISEAKVITMETFIDYTDRIIEACDNFDGDEVSNLSIELCGCSVNGVSLFTYFSEVKKYSDDFEYDQAMECTKIAVSEIKEVKE